MLSALSTFVKEVEHKEARSSVTGWGAAAGGKVTKVTGPVRHGGSDTCPGSGTVFYHDDDHDGDDSHDIDDDAP